MMHQTTTKLSVSAAVIFVSLILFAGHSNATVFPQFDVINPNVSFWVKIYSEYPTTKAVVHDNVNMDIIYDVIDLKPNTAPGARKTNRARMKRAKSKYKNILKKLAADPNIKNSDCKRVKDLFGKKAGTAAFKRAQNRVRCQIGQKDRFIKGLIRSGAYLDQIKEILKSYGVPEDLCYLPHVESSFNPEAYSKFGAAGMWQFTRSTGKRFMTVGYVLDERRDPIIATYAAARLLKENHEKLGSWPLAITAYNHGAAGMARARKKHGNYAAVFSSYRGRTFKFASRNFYSEFLAARKVASNASSFFGRIEMDPPKRFQTVVLEGYADLDDLLNHLDIKPGRIKSMNPALRKPVFTGQKYLPKGYQLRLPEGTRTRNADMALIPSSLYKKDQKPSRFYTVRRGDTAGRIARTHGVSLADLKLANNLGRRATIYPRQTLRIPQPGDPVLVQPRITLASKETVILPKKNRAKKKEPPKVLSQENADLAHVSVVDKANPENEEKEDQWILAKPSDQIVSAGIRFEKVIKQNNQQVGILIVEVEETLGHYADWAGVPTRKIRRLNKLPYGRVLHLKQRIKIPLDKTGSLKFEEKRYEYHKRLQEDFFAVYRVGDLELYRVRQGDSYWRLCREKFDVPLWLLRHYNSKIDLADLRIHQKLLIPAIEKNISV